MGKAAARTDGGGGEAQEPQSVEEKLDDILAMATETRDNVADLAGELDKVLAILNQPARKPAAAQGGEEKAEQPQRPRYGPNAK